MVRINNTKINFEIDKIKFEPNNKINQKSQFRPNETNKENVQLKNTLAFFLLNSVLGFK